MHTSDFSVTFLEALTADMRQLHETKTARPAVSPMNQTFLLISSLVAFITMRWT